MAVTNRKKSQPIKAKSGVTQNADTKVKCGETQKEATAEEVAKTTTATVKEYLKFALYALMITAVKAVIKFAYPDRNAYLNWQKSAVVTWSVLMLAQICLHLSSVFSKQEKSSGLVGGFAAVGAALGYHALVQQ